MIKALVMAAVAALSMATASAHDTTTVHRHVTVEQHHDVTEGSRHHGRWEDHRGRRSWGDLHERGMKRGHDRDRDRDDYYGQRHHGSKWVTKRVVKRVCNHEGRCRMIVKYVKVRR